MMKAEAKAESELLAGGLGRVLLIVVLVSGLPLNATAQATSSQADPFRDSFFAPDLVMQHARDIGLTQQQRTAITTAIQELQGQAVAKQLEMVEVVQSAVELVSTPMVDEERVIQVTRRVLALEQEVKLIQMRMLVRIKNALTPEQQQRLRELRGPDALTRLMPSAAPDALSSGADAGQIAR